MAHCTEAFSRSLPHSIRLLFQPFRLIYWFKAALLVLLIQGFSFFSSFEYFNQIPQPSNMDQWAEQAMEMLPLLAGVLIGSVLFAILMEGLRACARFLLFDAVREGFIYYKTSFNRHVSGILSLFLWNIIIKMIFFAVLLIAAILLLIPNWVLMTMVESRLGLIIALTLDFLFGLFVMFLVIAHSVLLNGVVVPQMAVKARGIFESWGNALRLIIDKPGDLIGFALIRLAVSMAMFLILFALAMLFGVFSVGFSAMLNGPEALIENPLFATQMQIPFQVVTTFLLLPIPLFQAAFALSFMAGVHRDQEYESAGNIRMNSESAPAPTSPPERGRSAKDDSHTDPFEGPISFKDIPTDSAAPPLETPPPGDENSADKNSLGDRENPLGDQPPRPPDKSTL